jgi:ribonuclease HI
MSLICYTDGACHGYREWCSTQDNSGPCGWCYTIVDNYQQGINSQRIVDRQYGRIDYGTIHRSKLTAIINALSSTYARDIGVIYTDSMYVVDGMTRWIETWKNKHFGDVQHSDLWKRIYDLSSGKNIEWRWLVNIGTNQFSLETAKMANDIIVNNSH